jgi:hypothetical protein
VEIQGLNNGNDATVDYNLSYIINDRCASVQLMTTKFTNAWYSKSLLWLEEQIQRAQKDGKPMVVLTHPPVSRELVTPSTRVVPILVALAPACSIFCGIW